MNDDIKEILDRINNYPEKLYCLNENEKGLLNDFEKVLKSYKGYTVEEISSLLKIGKSAVKKRLQRGREMLKLRLEDYEI